MGRARDIASLLTTSSALATDSEVAFLYTPLTSPITSYKNKIINGGFDIWQRGTSFSAGGYTADRWLLQVDGAGATRAVSQQVLTPASITGFESQFFLRYNQSVAGSGATYNIIEQRIEDVRTLSGQTVSVSFWAKADSNRTITSQMQQIFGTGGSAEVQSVATQTHNLTTSWQRFSYTATVASISGKTIGSDSYATFRFNFPLNSTFTVDIEGVQVERGSIATEFEQRHIADELRLCQRYYVRYSRTDTINGIDVSNVFPIMHAYGTGSVYGKMFDLPVRMRTSPDLTLSSPSHINPINAGGSSTGVFSAATLTSKPNFITLDSSSGSSGLTAGNASALNFTANFDLRASSEL